MRPNMRRVMNLRSMITTSQRVQFQALRPEAWKLEDRGLEPLQWVNLTRRPNAARSNSHCGQLEAPPSPTGDGKQSKSQQRWGDMERARMISRFVRPQSQYLTSHYMADSQNGMIIWFVDETREVKMPIEGLARRRLLLNNLAGLNSTTSASDDIPSVCIYGVIPTVVCL